MSQGVIARRYAKALISLADKDNSLENTGTSLTEITEVFLSSSELKEVLTDTKITTDKKQNILGDLLNKMDAPALVNTFVRYLLSKRRISILPGIERSFSSLLQEKLGRIEAGVTVAQELPQETIGLLEKSLSQYSGKNVTVQVSIDPSIVGGIVTRIGSVVVDGSIYTQLNQIRQSIIRG